MSVETSTTVTGLLSAARGGDQDARDRLMTLVYPELRKVAAHFMRNERSGHSLQVTGLVHEAVFRLLRSKVELPDRRYFFGFIGELMRHVLVDYARQRKAQKRGQDVVWVSIDDIDVAGPSNAGSFNDVDLIALDEALSKLELLDEQQSEIVKRKFFAGFTDEEIAAQLGISRSTVKRDWRAAKVWLRKELTFAPKQARN